MQGMPHMRNINPVPKTVSFVFLIIINCRGKANIVQLNDRLGSGRMICCYWINWVPLTTCTPPAHQCLVTYLTQPILQIHPHLLPGCGLSKRLIMILLHLSCFLLCLPAALGAKGAGGRNQVVSTTNLFVSFANPARVEWGRSRFLVWIDFVESFHRWIWKQRPSCFPGTSRRCQGSHGKPRRWRIPGQVKSQF